MLKEAYKNHRGQRNDLNGVGRNWTIVNVSNQLGVSTTKLKKLKSIQHYQPELLNDIDLGLISIGKAYEIVRKNYILNNSSETKIEDFESELFKLLMKYRPLNGELMETIEKYMSTLGSNEPKVDS